MVDTKPFYVRRKYRYSSLKFVWKGGRSYTEVWLLIGMFLGPLSKWLTQYQKKMTLTPQSLVWLFRVNVDFEIMFATIRIPQIPSKVKTPKTIPISLGAPIKNNFDLIVDSH